MLANQLPQRLTSLDRTKVTQGGTKKKNHIFSKFLNCHFKNSYRNIFLAVVEVNYRGEKRAINVSNRKIPDEIWCSQNFGFVTTTRTIVPRNHSKISYELRKSASGHIRFVIGIERTKEYSN